MINLPKSGGLLGDRKENNSASRMTSKAGGSIRIAVLGIVAFLVIISLQTSQSRWSDLQEELETKEVAHAEEIQKLQNEILKSKTELDDVVKEKDKAEKGFKEKFDKLQGKLQAKEADAVAKEKELKAALKKAKGAGGGGAREQQLEADLEDLRTDSIAALKASRDKASVLRRGLQGSEAVMAEKAVRTEQLNVTLLVVLEMLPQEQREEAAKHLSQLEMAAKDKRFAVHAMRLSLDEPALRAARGAAVQALDGARKEHARLAEAFTQAAAAGPPEEEPMPASFTARPASPSPSPSFSKPTPKSKDKVAKKAKEVVKEEVKGEEAEGGDDGEQAEEEGEQADSAEEEAEGQEAEVKEKEKEAGGEEEEEDSDQESGEFDLDFLAGGESEEDKKARLDEEKKQAERMKRAMQKEINRQEQEKYWAKYHAKEKKKKEKAAAAKQQSESADASVE